VRRKTYWRSDAVFIVLGQLLPSGFCMDIALICTGKGVLGRFAVVRSLRSWVSPFKEYAATIPHEAFMIFQAMFCRYYTRFDHRRLCGKNEVLCLPYFHGPLGDLCLRSRMSLDMGGRGMAQRHGSPRFCRWSSGPHQCRL